MPKAQKPTVFTDLSWGKAQAEHDAIEDAHFLSILDSIILQENQAVEAQRFAEVTEAGEKQGSQERIAELERVVEVLHESISDLQHRLETLEHSHRTSRGSCGGGGCCGERD